MLLCGGPGTKFIKPIQVKCQCDTAKTLTQDADTDDLLPDESYHPVFNSGENARMDLDHMEFPFSDGQHYPKKKLAEACVDSAAKFHDDDEEETKKPPSKLKCEYIFVLELFDCILLNQVHLTNHSTLLLSNQKQSEDEHQIHPKQLPDIPEKEHGGSISKNLANFGQAQLSRR